MTEEMKKLRDKLAKENANKFYHAQGDITQVMPWSDCKESFINGFDACYKEMQAQTEELMKSNKEMSDLIYSEDGYIASQDELNNEIRKWNELYILTSKQCDRTEKDRDTLKRQLEIAVKALEFVRTDYGGYAKEVEEGSEASYISEFIKCPCCDSVIRRCYGISAVCYWCQKRMKYIQEWQTKGPSES